ncbi:MAG: DEAD/DEAH box helicase [Acidobacteriota bacterium]
MPFSTLGLSPSLCTPLARLGYTQPTPVQTAAIPIVLDGRDLMARAQTGTGKTAAFGLPMIDRLLASRRHPAPRPGSGQPIRPGPRMPRGLVLVPTRELAVQVHKALQTYGPQLRVTAIFGGVAMRPQVLALQRGTDIVVATPGRLIDHLQQRTIDLSRVEMLTLDEADRMLDMGFLQPLRRVLAALPRERQTLLLSATLSDEVIRLAADFTRNPVRVDVSDAQVVAPTVTHRIHPVADGRKGDLLKHVLTQAPVGQALVFCKTKRGSDRVGELLERAGVKAAVINGNKSQGARTRALGDFKAGRAMVLVATDIAARGLDIARLPLVVNYDLPLVAQDYIHRVGRTGRAGLAGRALSLVSPAERTLLRDIQRLLPAPLEQVVVEGFEVPRSSGREPATPSRQPQPRASIVSRRSTSFTARRPGDDARQFRSGFRARPTPSGQRMRRGVEQRSS